MSNTAKGTEYGTIGPFLSRQIIIRPNKRINVLGNGSDNFRLGKHTFFCKIYNFMHFERHIKYQLCYQVWKIDSLGLFPC